MSVLLVSLDGNASEIIGCKADDHALSLAIRLYHEYEASLPIVIASPSPDAVGYRGSAFFSIAYASPVSGRMEAAYSNVPFGYSMRRLGFDAIVIIGRARHLAGLYISEAGAEAMEAGQAGLPSWEWAAGARKSISDTYMAIGPAGENGIVFASLQTPSRDIASNGLGYLFGQRNLKGLIIPSFQRNDTYSDTRKAARTVRRIERSELAKRFRKEGDGCVIDDALRLRWLPVDSYSRRFDPRACFLDGKAISDKYGMFPQSCQDCFFSCGRRTRDNEAIPSYAECIMLGTNLGFFAPESVLSLAREARNSGLDASHLGALLSYLSEDGSGDFSMPHPRKGSLEEHVRAIRIIAQGHSRLSKGLAAFPDAVQSGYHHPITSDLRGDYPSAIAASVGLDEPLIARMLPRVPLTAESAAAFFLYEKAISYALLSRGYSPLASAVLWWRLLPKHLYRFPAAIRIFASMASMFGMGRGEILSEGFRILEELEGEPMPIPERFTFDIDAMSDARTVPYTRLMAAYRSEKLRLENTLRSRRERRLRPRSSSRAAEGPADDLGRDGDPGLQK